MYFNNFREKFKQNMQKRGEEAKQVRKIVFIILVSLSLLIIISGISGYLYIKSALNPVDPDSDETIRVEIPIGSSTLDIAQILEDHGVIKNARIFAIYSKFTGSSNFQAGEYAFTPSITIDELIEALENGMVSPIYTITIPEGLILEEIAAIYAEQFAFDNDDFMEKVNDISYVEQLIEQYPDLLTEEILNPDIKNPLEGYLFASTYEFYDEQPSIESVVEMMLDRTQAAIEPYLDEIDEKGITVHEAITFASLVENEAKTEKQRREISGVFYNRLEEGMKLQTDPTVLYALGEHKDRVLYEDLEIESPYNTYQIDALPVGPISNFHKSSLEAVLYPDESDYLYFLHDGEGAIYYSETYEDHLEKREKYIINEREE